MKITLKDEDNVMRDTFLIEYGGQCGEKAYTRVITRETNEEGKWRRLIKEIEDLANTYSVEFDDAIKLFEDVSCCKKSFKMALENKYHVRWCELDDLGVGNMDSAEYNHLIKTRGVDEVERRRRFLGYDNKID